MPGSPTYVLFSGRGVRVYDEMHTPGISRPWHQIESAFAELSTYVVYFSTDNVNFATDIPPQSCVVAHAACIARPQVIIRLSGMRAVLNEYEREKIPHPTFHDSRVLSD